MQVHVVQGKGKKDRYTILSTKALEVLRQYYKYERPSCFLFEAQGKKGKPLADQTLNTIVKKAAVKAGIKKQISFHTLTKCQFVKKTQWVDKLMAVLPPVKHFHVVFTIPTCLHKLFYLNQDKAYGLLFKAAGKALMQCAINPDFLGAQAGAVAMLHTWGQTLTYHPHIHMIVPGGGLSV